VPLPCSRVAHTLSLMYAPHERAQHLCPLALGMVRSGFMHPVWMNASYQHTAI
jgi:hypothetical protein